VTQITPLSWEIFHPCGGTCRIVDPLAKFDECTVASSVPEILKGF